MNGDGWSSDKLQNLCLKIGSGATPRGGKEAYLAEGPFSLIRSQNVLDFTFSSNGLAFISETQARQLSNVEVQEGDVLLNITGDSVARVCQTPDWTLPARVNQHVAILRPNRELLLPGYLKYYLLEPKFKNFMLGMASVGGTRNALTKGMIEDFVIQVPGLPTQTRIATILSALDDKIELNRQTNATLEAIAQAIFKEWFVDFRFPGATEEMEDSELGLIPKGWSVYKLGELVDSVSKTHKFAKNEVVFLNTSDIEAGKVLHKNYSQVEGLPGQAKKSIQRFDILFTEIRPENKRFALIDFDADDYVVSTKLMVLRVKADIHPIVIYNYLTCNETINWLQHIAESRSGTFPQITFNHVSELKLALPPKQLLTEYSNLAWANFQQVKDNDQQIAVLSVIRDNLLPKLMSGEIEV
ncbi:MAG: restriction endonuclease subunit S [Desulfobulbaceae bacterium]|nr:restriction endonuclease subunit S [Desulfobulbaceae bacterium]